MTSTITSTVSTSITLGTGNYGLYLAITASGSVQAGNGANAISAYVSNAYLVNQGSVRGGTGFYNRYTMGGIGGTGVALHDGGTLHNAGSIDGGNGGGSRYAPGGQGGAGVYLSGGSIINTGNITGGNGGTSGLNADGGGGAGVYLSGGTLTNAGTISGGASESGRYPAGDAVQFGRQSATLVIDPGAVFNGSVVANGPVGDVLELAGTTAATLTGLGTQFENFTTLDFAAGSTWTVDSTLDALDSGERIDGLAPGDAIVLQNFAASSEAYVPGTGLELTSGGNSYTLDISIGANAALSVSVAAGNTVIESLAATISNAVTGSVCDAGTLTITDTGSVIPSTYGATAVTLNAGGDVLFNEGVIGGARGSNGANGGNGGTGVALSGGTLTNAGTITGGGGGGSFYSAGATGGVGVSLSSGTLINDGSIAGGGGYSAYGSKGAHAAGGAGVYLNGGTLITAGTITGGGGGLRYNRTSGAAGDAVQFGGSNAATLVIDPGAVFNGQVAASTHVNDVLELSGTTSATLDGITTDPDLHLLVDGARIDGCAQADGDVLFHVPPLPRSVVIASRAASQDELGLARDPRRLGVAIAQLRVGRNTIIRADALAANSGFHAYEPLESCCWTNGRAELPAALFAAPAPLALQIRVRHTTHYPVLLDKAA